MATSASDFLSKLIATFRLEADEHLQMMTDGLLELEKASLPTDRQPVLEVIYREAHSLKGAARAVDLLDVEAICQALEGVFARLKRGEIELQRNGFDAVHQALGVVEMLLSKPNEPHATQVAEAVQALAHLELGVKTSASPTEPTSTAFLSNSQDISQPYSRNHGNGVIPELQEQNPAILAFHAAGQLAPTPTPVQTKGTTSDTIRVSTEKLNSLFLQAEEMISMKLATSQRATDLHDVALTLRDWRKEWAKISPETRRLQRILETQDPTIGATRPEWQTAALLLDFFVWNEKRFTDIEQKVRALTKSTEHDQQTIEVMVDSLLNETKKTLMMPFSSLLTIFPKMVRDLSRNLGKDVELTIHGAEVEIDKRILEEMKDPLIHLLRNAVDHGIEMPDVRAQGGKLSCGTLTISIAQVSGSMVEVLIADDGTGIDHDKVKWAAVKRGLLTNEEAAGLDEKAALALIFQSEVSTSPIVTDISGRGLGMAIVREKVEKLGGQITIETTLHQGATFHILLPLTLATFRGVQVQVADHLFVIPTASIEQVVRLKSHEIHSIEGRETLILHGRMIPLVRTEYILGLEKHTLAKKFDDIVSILLRGTEDRCIAFTVDSVLTEQEVLFKNLGAYLSPVPNIAGATVLGSGSVVPVLHVPDLLKAAMDGTASGFHTAALTETKDTGPQSILVAEDSVTSRMLIKGILENAGYSVTTAVDGQEAFSLLKKGSFDLVVSDVEMPRLDGFGLTAQIRSDAQYSQLPIVLVTGLDSREDRERGIRAGADAYIVKTNFDQSNLLDVVQRLI